MRWNPIVDEIRGNRWQLWIGLALSVACVGGCGGDDDTIVAPASEPTTAAGFTARGWDRFTAGNFAGAETDFASALDLDESYGPALAGRGWARLSDAATAADLQLALANFDGAIAAGENAAYVFAGLAATKLSLGGAAFADAVTDVQAALSASPEFVFDYRTSFDSSDLRLIGAFAEAAQGHFQAALDAADEVVASDIDPDHSESWNVGGITYDSFVGAVLAFLHFLAAEYAG
jgi:tetratricopeptide (TPR) repeat protein